MAEKMKSAEAAAPLIDNGDVKKLLSLLSKVEGDRAKEFSQAGSLTGYLRSWCRCGGSWPSCNKARSKRRCPLR